MQRTNSFTLDELARGQQEDGVDASVIPPGGVAQHLAALASQHSSDDSAAGLAALASSPAPASTSPPGSGGPSPLLLPTMSPGPGGVFSCPHALAASASAAGAASAAGRLQRRRRPAARRAGAAQGPGQGPGQSEDDDDDGGSDTSSSSSVPRLSRLSVGVGPYISPISPLYLLRLTSVYMRAGSAWASGLSTRRSPRYASTSARCASGTSRS